MAVPLWKGSALIQALGLRAGISVPDVLGIAIDSRTLHPGDLFVALDGGNDPRYHGAGGGGRDGHDFVADAARRGAAAALVARPCGTQIAELLVPDPFAALWQLARAGRARFERPVFAITGSSGKTTAKSMLTAAIAGSHGAEGSFNNHLGVPLSLARLPADSSAGVFELGMNAPGEIAPLAELVRPQVALVLNVLPVHLEGLGSLEAIRREKLSISVGLQPGGTLVVPDELNVDGAATSRLLRFGRRSDADIQLRDGDTDEPRVCFPDGEQLPLHLRTDGPHRRLTATAVLACLYAGGLDRVAGLEAIEQLVPPAGRGGSLAVAGITVIDDSYNANPESVRLALRALAERPARRRVALLGDMLELGPQAPAMHRELAPECLGLDGVFCVGEHMRALYDELPLAQRWGWWPDCTALPMAALVASLEAGDALLVKGSNRLFWRHGTVRELAASLAAAQD